jgi:hypothetical protein
MRDARFEFKVGLFQDTLPEFLTTFGRRGRLVVHLDADLYTSTLFVLTSLAHLLQPGDILLFDEFCSVLHEFKAFQEFVSAFPVRCTVAYTAANFEQVCVRIESAVASRHRNLDMVRMLAS